MASLSRYARTSLLNEGKKFGTPDYHVKIRNAIATGAIRTQVVVTQEGQRLDHIAGKVYGDARLWWVIATASNIGFAPQVPPGTRLLVPIDINEVRNLVG